MVWICDWQASKEADLMQASSNLQELIFCMAGKRVKLLTPQQEKEVLLWSCKNCHKLPYHFLASSMTKVAGDILLAHLIISTLETTAFILPYVPQLPYLLCTIEGFILSICSPEAIAESEYVAMQIARKTLLTNKMLISLLKSKLVGDTTSQCNTMLVTDILDSIKARLVMEEDSVDRSKKF